MTVDILTVFPEMFGSVFSASILGRAREQGLLDIRFTDIRSFSAAKHKNTDDYPFGGGAGMVMTAQPILDAMAAASASLPGARRIYLGPRGRKLTTALARELAAEESLILLCGHYEGVDQRALDECVDEEISIGDYILTGGELAAMVLVDCVSRLVPGVLGSGQSLAEESIYSGLLEYPQYTKPRSYEGWDVPEVLVNGNHKLIHLWQYEQSLRLTKERRPDLFDRYLQSDPELSKDEKKILEIVMRETQSIE